LMGTDSIIHENCEQTCIINIHDKIKKERVK
jgi:hypothetical protein